MPFEIVRNDITRMKADAIVDTANPHATIGAGTDYAIHKAAGPKLLEARTKIGEIPPGQCAATPAYRLHARYVLHAVGPVWQDGSHHEAELLRSAYDAALSMAASLKCRSVAFPLMAAGSYGFPHEVALSVAIQAFTDFLMAHDMRISLVLFGEDAFSLAGTLFDDLRSFIDNNYVSAQLEEEYDAPRCSLRSRREQFTRRAANRAECDSALTGAARKPAAQAPVPSGGGLQEFLQQSESSFSEHLLDLLKEKGMKDSEVYRRAQVSRQLFNKIINKKDYQPAKSTAIQLALGLELDLAQTQKLLDKAGYSLTRSSKADLVIQYYIARKEYSIVKINVALADCGLPLLKTGTSA